MEIKYVGIFKNDHENSISIAYKDNSPIIELAEETKEYLDGGIFVCGFINYLDKEESKGANKIEESKGKITGQGSFR